MKKQKIEKWFLSFVLLLIGTLVHAEGGCPPGMIPHSGTDISSCGPIPPGYNQPSGYWMDQWAAQADSDDGTVGLASDQPNEKAAKQASIDNCQARGGTRCRVNLTYKNGCIAIVSGINQAGEERSNISTGTLDGSISNAINVCKSWGKTNCHVFRTTCGLPKWMSD